MGGVDGNEPGNTVALMMMPGCSAEESPKLTCRSCRRRIGVPPDQFVRGFNVPSIGANRPTQVRVAGAVPPTIKSM